MTNRRGGRTPSLDLPFDDTGKTIAERIIEKMANGTHVDTAASSCGIARGSLHEYLKIGAQARTALARGHAAHPDDPNRDHDLPTLSDHQARCLWFSDATEKAADTWAYQQEQLLHNATTPGRTREIVTEKYDAEGELIERTRRIEEDGPDLPTLRWRVERHPATRRLYRPAPTELSGPDGDPIPVDVRIADIADTIAAIRARNTPNPDTTTEDT